jgi:hypothetical protein
METAENAVNLWNCLCICMYESFVESQSHQCYHSETFEENKAETRILPLTSGVLLDRYREWLWKSTKRALKACACKNGGSSCVCNGTHRILPVWLPNHFCLPCASSSAAVAGSDGRCTLSQQEKQVRSQSPATKRNPTQCHGARNQPCHHCVFRIR